MIRPNSFDSGTQRECPLEVRQRWAICPISFNVRILVVEDEERLASALRRGLEAEGVVVDVAARGDEGLWLATEQAFDVIVLDLMPPGMNGFQVCAKLREAGMCAPILMLTAKDGALNNR